jgi:hypothetical protein
VLQDVGAEFAQERAVLAVNLNLMRGRTLGNHDVSRCLDHAHTIRVQKLSVAFAALAKLKLKCAVFVEDLF